MLARKDMEAETEALVQRRPMFLKVAPDLNDTQVMDICDAVARHGVNGVIAGNTTLSRPETLRSQSKDEAGGLSGAPLTALSTRTVGRFHAFAGGRFPLIGVGGIASGADAYAKIRAGACAVQLYSALVYGGPGWWDGSSGILPRACGPMASSRWSRRLGRAKVRAY